MHACSIDHVHPDASDVDEFHNSTKATLCLCWSSLNRRKSVKNTRPAKPLLTCKENYFHKLRPAVCHGNKTNMCYFFYLYINNPVNQKNSNPSQV